jgi:hypothetical protein
VTAFNTFSQRTAEKRRERKELSALAFTQTGLFTLTFARIQSVTFSGKMTLKDYHDCFIILGLCFLNFKHRAA